MKGGYRPGAGRKKGFAARSSEDARRVFAGMLMAEIKPIAEALITKAKSGDVSAAKELFDRSWGKPIQSSELASLDNQSAESKPMQEGVLLLEYQEYCRANRLE